MTKREMAVRLVNYFPRTNVKYWMKFNKEVVQLNHDAAVRYWRDFRALCA